MHTVQSCKAWNCYKSWLYQVVSSFMFRLPFWAMLNINRPNIKEISGFPCACYSSNAYASRFYISFLRSLFHSMKCMGLLKYWIYASIINNIASMDKFQGSKFPTSQDTMICFIRLASFNSIWYGRGKRKKWELGLKNEGKEEKTLWCGQANFEWIVIKQLHYVGTSSSYLSHQFVTSPKMYEN